MEKRPLTVELQSYTTVLMRFALSLTGNYGAAEDLVQETIVRALGQKREIQRVADPKAWLFTILINLWRDHCRKTKRRPRQQSLQLQNSVADSDPAVQYEIREYLSQVLEYFQTLPEQQRQILYLKTVEDYLLEDIATMLDTTMNNVKSNLSIARKKIRSHFHKEAAEQS